MSLELLKQEVDSWIAASSLKYVSLCVLLAISFVNVGHCLIKKHLHTCLEGNLLRGPLLCALPMLSDNELLRNEKGPFLFRF